MTIDYLALTKDCQTDNQFNRVHIDLFSMMTPKEFASLAQEAQAGVLPVRVGKWLAPMARYCPQILTSPEPFERTEINTHMTWLRAPGRGDGSKRVLLLFCGNSDRPMMPLPLFLQALSATRWDVFKVVRKTYPGPRPNEQDDGSVMDETGAQSTAATHRRYLRPGTEVADFQAIMADITDALKGIPREQVVCIGNSMGSWVALAAALTVRSPRCVVLSGAFNPDLVALVPRLIGGSPAVLGAGKDILHTFGADRPQDRASAETAQAVWGGSLLGFPGIKDHATLFPLLRQGLFYKLLDPLLTGGTLPPEIVAHDLR
jgi:pimeloyl-ACP methyl ester carboxylesterase